MSWLFPLYLAGAAAVIAPILLHLRRQPPKDRVAFSSLMFLQETERQPTRRRRLENWLLLLMRCLILILLALMFARPFSRSGESGEAGKGESVVILVDRSASMRRGDLWSRAVAEAREAVAATGPADRVAAGVFDAGVKWILAGEEGLPETRKAALAAGLESNAPGWGATDLGRALVEGLEVFGQREGSEGGRRRLVVVSDFQEGAKLGALQKVAWPQGVQVERRLVAKEGEGNLTLELVSGRTDEEAEAGEPGGTARLEPVRRVRVSSSRESVETAFQLAWEGGGDGAEARGYLPPGGRRVIKMPPRSGLEGQPGTLRLAGDQEDFDNRVHVAPSQPRQVRVRVAVEKAEQLEAAASPGYYLKRALQPTPAIRPVVEAVEGKGWKGENGAAVLVNGGDGSRLGLEGIAEWRRVLEQGGLGIYVVDGPGAEAELKALTDGLNWKVAEVKRDKEGGYAMLGELDARDRLLAPFADARLRDFTKVRFWRHRVVEVEGKGVTVLARFDTGDAAMTVVRQGAGTLLVLASGWHPADSQLALSTKFVPLWFGWLAAAGFAHEDEATLEAGQALPWELKAEGKVTGPDGKVSVLKAGERHVAEQPGVYRVEQGGPEAETRWFAAQLPEGEGRVSTMPEERLRELGVNVAAGERVAEAELSEAARQRLDGMETEARQRWWLWALAGILALAAAESLLGGRRERVMTAA